MQILNQNQVKQKIKRLAIEILERNFEEEKIILAGINNNGLRFAKLLTKELKTLSEVEIVCTQLKLNPADPLSADVTLDLPLDEIKENVLIIVDDVANTGRTIFYAFKPFLNILARKIEVAVLIDRKHKSFPVKVDYKGLSLATTMAEVIRVDLQNMKNAEVNLV